jgi:hypothetical protein
MAELVSAESNFEKDFEELEKESRIFSDYQLLKEQLLNEEKNTLKEQEKHKEIDNKLDQLPDKKD